MTTFKRYQEVCIAHTERAMLVSQIDACLVVPLRMVRDANYATRTAAWWRGFRGAKPSEHEYSYSMGIGDAWKVHVPKRDTLNLKPCYWQGGTIYEYGLEPPRYPVPAML